MKTPKFEVAKILKAHGVKGEVKAAPFTDDPHRFDYLKWVYIDDEKYYISGVKYHKNSVIVKFEGVDTLEQCELLCGKLMVIDRKYAVSLPANSYFVKDLLQMEVRDTDGKYLGVITDIISTGSNDVYVVSAPEGNHLGVKEVLVPALRKVVLDVRIDDNYMTVALPEGLI